MLRQITISTCVALCLSMMGGASFAQEVRTGPCIDGNLWLYDVDDGTAHASYVRCLHPSRWTFRLFCRPGAPYGSILVAFSEPVTADQFIQMTFSADQRNYTIDGITRTHFFSGFPYFDGSLDMGHPILRALRRAETFAINGFAIHTGGAGEAITDMLSYCGRG